MYEKMSENGKIICQYCGKEYAMITPTHLKTHSKTIEDYKEEFPDYPITSKQMNARQELRSDRNKSGNDLFKRDEEKLNEVSPSFASSISDEEIIVAEPLAENSDYPDPYESIPKDKLEILNFLRRIYHSITNNYIIEQFTLSGHLEYTFCVDIADPTLKIVFDFPNALWHNKTRPHNIHKNRLLTETGWTIKTFNEANPTVRSMAETMNVVIDV